MTMVAITPVGLYGTGDVSFAYSNLCITSGVLICRPGTTVGAMKGLITITHRTGPGVTQYELNFGCFDKDMNVLPDAADTLTRTMHILGPH